VVVLLGVMFMLFANGVRADDDSNVIPAVCAEREIAVITLIEDHAAEDDTLPEKLTEAYFAMLEARATCYAERVTRAVAGYDQILITLGKLHIGSRR